MIVPGIGMSTSSGSLSVSTYFGYGVGQVDLPEGPRVQAVLSGGENDFRIGMPMRLELESRKQNPEGQDVVIFRFRPAERAMMGDAR